MGVLLDYFWERNHTGQAVNTVSQRLRSGEGSTNFQAGRDISGSGIRTEDHTGDE